jgi:hypothetical protein
MRQQTKLDANATQNALPEHHAPRPFSALCEFPRPVLVRSTAIHPPSASLKPASFASPPNYVTDSLYLL